MSPSWPTIVSPSRELAMQATPGLLLVSIAGRVTWAEYEPILSAVYREEVLGPRHLVLARIEPTSVRDLPDDEFRQHGAKTLIERHAAQIAGFAYLIAGRGFMASIAQSVVAGVSLISRTPYPERTLSDPSKAADWLSEQLPGGPSPAQILERVELLVRTQQHG
jgi:hypothetical protein